MKEKQFSTYQIVFVAVMAALVCVVTFFRFPFLGSKVHFANAMCLLSGMLFGPVLGGIPAVLMAFGISWQRALITIGVLFLVQQIDGLVISPRVMGSVTGFSPGTVLLALYFGSKLGGIGGLLLAVPALTAIRTLYRVFVQRYEKN